jgi:hypothetical protein
MADTMVEMAYFIMQESQLSAFVIMGVLESDNNKIKLVNVVHIKGDKLCTYNVTLRRVCITTVAKAKQ